MNEYLAIGDKLAHYMALSCNHSVVMSSLCGSFWEPDIPCNLVSAWLHPVLEEIPRHPEIADDPVRYAEIVALMCGTRRPRLSALWVGAALSGLVPKIIAAVRRGTPPLDPNGFSWTGSPQSFMDLAGSGPYFHREASGDQSIERADAWRLLYLPVLEDDGLYYNSLPFSPWQPVGKTREQNCALRVRAHETCPRHRLVYIHWTWQLQDGSKLIDSGFRLDDHEPRQLFSRVQSPSEASFAYPRIPLSSTQGASREASMEIFRWVLANHEGRPPEEPIYDDDWIAGCDDSDRYGSDPGIKDCPNDIVMGFPEGNSNNQQISSLQEDRIRRWVEDI
ncbi:uncharacterized protein LDX57_009908 [Aspergillus melleus]|uniref:uncharacterized protein n=1 Tax=Aspergillus melleus TaxID=138277 RepID=UPI001E8CF755|nr:uncharacterized protein LDX57_009908 [Aspergillus melleus]KAH8432269.1 hypothetical protein LDX57_009908 [Aspergillus melleus]